VLDVYLLHVRFDWSDIGTACSRVDTVVVGRDVFSTVVGSAVAFDAVVSGTVILITHKSATGTVGVTDNHTGIQSARKRIRSRSTTHSSFSICQAPKSASTATPGGEPLARLCPPPQQWIRLTACPRNEAAVHCSKGNVNQQLPQD